MSSSPTQTIRIVIAASRPIFRDGLRRLLETESQFEIVGETGPGPDVATVVHDARPDVLLLDFTLPAAFDTLNEVAATGTGARAILLVDNVDAEELPKALQLSARGLVLKDSAAEVLFQSIHAVLAGEYWIASERVPDAPTSIRRLEEERRRRRAFGLTPRELEIVRLVVGGYANKEIAEKLSIGENTVKSHMTHIFNKLGASSRIELALFAAHHRLLDSV